MKVGDEFTDEDLKEYFVWRYKAHGGKVVEMLKTPRKRRVPTPRYMKGKSARRKTGRID